MSGLQNPSAAALLPLTRPEEFIWPKIRDALSGQSEQGANARRRNRCAAMLQDIFVWTK
ncbi:MAG: hypothetical protein RQ723_11925 [Desulfuromonadales bacterium]|nr:hypothetical protein [Desulfuromonadales bacterium]